MINTIINILIVIVIYTFIGGEEGMQHQCPHCTRKYTVIGSLRRHLKYDCGRRQREVVTGYSVTDRGFECSTCTRCYKVFGSLKRHLKYECEKQPNIPCPVTGCLYKAKVPCRMTQHVRMVHKLEC